MNLSSTGALELRRRSVWEAADSGLLLWRKNFVFFLPFFALPFWVCAFGLWLLPDRFHTFVWFILWFLKPLFDRPVLHVISVRFFEEGAGFSRLCRGLGRSIFRGLAGDLLWRRFSPLRPAVMPVRVLENLQFQKARDRRRALQKGGIGFCSFLTVWGMLLETILLAGELLFCMIMMQIIFGGFIDSVNEYFSNTKIIVFTAWCVNYILIESIYVCMGFGLYLNSRIEVEGWDIEIMFKNFGEKIKRKNCIPALVIFFAALFLFVPADSFAADGADSAENPPFVIKTGEAPFETLRSVLDSPDFGGEQDGWGIRFKNQRDPSRMSDIDLAPWLAKIRQVFAFLLRLVLIAAIAALAVFLFLYFRKTRKSKISLKNRPKITFLREFGQENPESLLEKAKQYFSRGEFRPAWAYCTSAAIGFLSLRRGLAFPPDVTEYGCLQIVREKIAHNGADAFAALIENWVNFAYGGRLPPQGSFEQALEFCNSLGDV